ncbi:hypothetical protein GCM10018962_74970 [Dactylosporangium matsuzakiense]|uniref:Uncharacterized protein n=1 Tax=Dactylosporangium matsuzakiense TaxID=53360 RepID=A0A9W6L0L2_9ACTN|nr:hypothetical protein GCM10017581_106330 [Dactylosporangium matsuzakiense]
MRGTDSATEVHVVRFRSRAGYESFMVDPSRLGYRDGIGDAAPITWVIEVRDLWAHRSSELGPIVLRWRHGPSTPETLMC